MCLFNRSLPFFFSFNFLYYTLYMSYNKYSKPDCLCLSYLHGCVFMKFLISSLINLFSQTSLYLSLEILTLNSYIDSRMVFTQVISSSRFLTLSMHWFSSRSSFERYFSIILLCSLIPFSAILPPETSPSLIVP